MQYICYNLLRCVGKCVTVHFVPVTTLRDAQKPELSRCKTRDFGAKYQSTSGDTERLNCNENVTTQSWEILTLFRMAE